MESHVIYEGNSCIIRNFVRYVDPVELDTVKLDREDALRIHKYLLMQEIIGFGYEPDTLEPTVEETSTGGVACLKLIWPGIVYKNKWKGDYIHGTENGCAGGEGAY